MSKKSKPRRGPKGKNSYAGKKGSGKKTHTGGASTSGMRHERYMTGS